MPKKVYYQGVPGAYSHIAAKHLFPDALHKGFDDFNKPLQATLRSKDTVAVMPFDNTVIGSIYEMYDLLYDHPELKIVGELMLKIDHNLLGLPHADIKDIKVVYSHPKALAQCKSLFKKYPDLNAMVYEDTAAAAALVSKNGNKTIAAIASKAAAEEYGLKILKKKVQSNGENYTRFVVLDSIDEKYKLPKSQTYKTSIVFAAAHSPGSLLACMKPFADKGLNLTKIESRPMMGKPWQYLFYLDFEHEGTNGEIKEVLKKIKPHTQVLRILGTYPKGDTIEE
jgi:prephenate dehydratase